MHVPSHLINFTSTRKRYKHNHHRSFPHKRKQKANMCRAMDTNMKTLSLSSRITTTSYGKERDQVAVTTVPIKFRIVQDGMLNTSSSMIDSPKKTTTKNTSVLLPSSCQQGVEEKQQQQVRFKDHIQCRWSLESDNDRLPRVARRSVSVTRRSI